MLLEVNLYIDVIFAVNFVMNFIIFFATKKLLRLNTTHIRMCVASFIASITYCVAIVYFEFNTVNKIILSGLIFIIPIIVGFRPKSIVELFKIIISVYIVSTFVGGVTFATMYYINTNSYIQNFIYVATNKITIKLLIFSVIFSYLLIKASSVILNQYFTKSKIYIVQILKNKNVVTLKGIIDTGNSLYEPKSFKPVLVSEYEILKDMLQKDFDDDVDTYNIPYKSVGEANGKLTGVMFDKVVILNNKLGDLVLENQIIAIYKGKFTNNDEYNMLIHPRILG
ncbi:MAG TPA: hypothetical protein DCP90_06045 [Clostridiales bacterium]|nr:MAG: hypothetical protein A2Y22_09255 [Clostridiales bacterium GWD2_32_59]HAN10155.1 hypothetical protein [Clostridiales bacterium]